MKIAIVDDNPIDITVLTNAYLSGRLGRFSKSGVYLDGDENRGRYFLSNFILDKRTNKCLIVL